MIRPKRLFLLIDGDETEDDVSDLQLFEAMLKIKINEVSQSDEYSEVVCVTMPHEHSYTKRLAIVDKYGLNKITVPTSLMFASLSSELNEAELDGFSKELIREIKFDIMRAISIHNYGDWRWLR